MVAVAVIAMVVVELREGKGREAVVIVSDNKEYYYY